MKPRRSNKSNTALTLTEVLVVISILALLAVVLLPKINRRQSPQFPVNCSFGVGRILAYYQEWAGDHGGKFPMEISVVNGGTKELITMGDVISSFQVISNQLLDPRLLYCWSDTNHTVFQLSPGPHLIDSLPTNFLSVSGLKNHISYFVGLDASASRPNALLCGDDNFEIGGTPVKPGLLEFSTNSPIAWTFSRHSTYKRHFWNTTTSYGNVGLVDGSVHLTTVSSRTNLLQATGLATNRLAIP